MHTNYKATDVTLDRISTAVPVHAGSHYGPLTVRQWRDVYKETINFNHMELHLLYTRSSGI